MMSAMERKERFRTWCQKKISELLESPIDEELVDYLMSIESEKDAREYLHQMLRSESTCTQAFIGEFFRHWCPPLPSPNNKEEGMEVLVRPRSDQMVLFSDSKEKEPPGFSRQPAPSSQKDGRRSHTKQSFVPLMSTEGQSRATMYLPGRNMCQCLAQKHNLINNCVKCGRIVCSQEGSGPCMFCGAVVCTAEEEEWLMKDSKKAIKFKEQFLKKHRIEDVGRPLDHLQACGVEQAQRLSKAELRKEKLLEFDRTSTSRTRVIDDQSDYFSVNAKHWLSPADKEALQQKEETLREKKYASRKNKAVTLDIAGRRVVEDVVVDLYTEKHVKEALASRIPESEDIQTHAGVLYNSSIPCDRPLFVENKENARILKAKVAAGHQRDAEVKRHKLGRIQDNSLQEMKDEGYCLSMHQPWATLLVAGIKKCEGRSWYSTHRGRLWIAATSQEPSVEDISHVQEFYIKLYEDQYNQKDLFFPLDYPTKCLLGCVDVLDCLAQDEYMEKFPLGESEADYIFIVDNPQQLTVKFPIRGECKIWKLKREDHQAAKRGLIT